MVLTEASPAQLVILVLVVTNAFHFNCEVSVLTGTIGAIEMVLYSPEAHQLCSCSRVTQQTERVLECEALSVACASFPLWGCVYCSISYCVHTVLAQVALLLCSGHSSHI